MYNLDLKWDCPSALSSQSREHVLRIRILPTETNSGIPLRVAIAIDTSGSMRNAGKLEAAKHACNTIIAMLRPEDRLSIASFSTGVETLVRDKAGGDEAASAASALDQLEPRGKTRTDLALDWIENALHSEEGILCVGFLITDGHATDRVGKKLEDLSSLIDQSAKIAETGIALFTAGLGDASKFNQQFLVEVGDKGRGGFLFAQDACELGSQLGSRFARAQLMGDANASLIVEKEMSQLRLLQCCKLRPDYAPLSVVDSGNRASIPIGAVSTQTPTDILLRVCPPALPFGEALGSRKMLEVNLDLSGKQAINESVSLSYTASYREAQTQDPEVNRDRQIWDIKRYNDELIKVNDPMRTGELLETIRDVARKTGVLDVAVSADEALADLRKTGVLEANLKTRTTTTIRSNPGDIE